MRMVKIDGEAANGSISSQKALEREALRIINMLGRRMAAAKNVALALEIAGICSVVAGAYKSKDSSKIKKAKILSQEIH